jgi:dihydrofolate reductase
MGELHVNMKITLDGVIQVNGGPTEQDGDFEYAGWERLFWDSESGPHVEAIVQASDALLLGRTTYDIFRPYWPGQSSEIGRVFNRIPKYVASRGMPELSWDASTQITAVAPRFVTCVSGMSRSTRGQREPAADPVPRGPGRPGEPVGVSDCDRAGQEALS